MFEKFAEFPVIGWVLVAALAVAGILLFRAKKGGEKTVWTTKMLSLGAICMALSCVLSLVRLWKMPQGGSVTAASMLPMMLFAYMYGVGPGITLGALYGVMQFLLEPWMLNVPQVLLDYPIAFGMVGLAGILRRHNNVSLRIQHGILHIFWNLDDFFHRKDKIIQPGKGYSRHHHASSASNSNT